MAKITVTEQDWITHSLRKLEQEGVATILRWEHDLENNIYI